MSAYLCTCGTQLTLEGDPVRGLLHVAYCTDCSDVDTPAGIGEDESAAARDWTVHRHDGACTGCGGGLLISHAGTRFSAHCWCEASGDIHCDGASIARAIANHAWNVESIRIARDRDRRFKETEDRE